MTPYSLLFWDHTGMVSVIRKRLGAYKYKFFSGLARKLVQFDIDLGIQTPDRALLENTILPFFAGDKDYGTILFVGCEWYTRKYNKLFQNQTYITMEMDPDLAAYGSNHHIIDKIENIGHHFGVNHFDLVVCNGVYGWGLNGQEQIETAFNGIYDCLRPGGVFLLGWNDDPDHHPVPHERLKSLKRFKKWPFSPLKTSSFLANEKTGHTYDFYQKS